jgi:hypothetical protein
MCLSAVLTRTLFSALVVLVVVFPVGAELIQLAPVETKVPADPVRERNAWELGQIESGKVFVIRFVTRLDADAKYRLTSASYKHLGRTADSLRRAFNKESYNRIEFLRTDLMTEGSAQRPEVKELSLKANLYWFAEGYDGVQTFYFILKREAGDWVLQSLVY